MIKFDRRFGKAALAACAAVFVCGLAGCASSSDSEETSTDAVSQDLTSPATSSNDTSSDDAYVNPYTLNSINVFEIDVSEYVDVSSWKDTVVTEEDVTEPEFEVMYGIAYALENTYGLSTSEITDRAVQGGDTVNIDFTGYVDGEELDGGSGSDYDLTIGSGSFIDGFEEGLVGHEIGDEVELNLTFPDPYPNNTELSGVDVTFKVTINSITGFENVSDDDVNTATSGEYETYSDLEEALRSSETEDYEKSMVWQKVLEQVTTLSTCDTLSDDFINTYLYSYGCMGEAYNISVETILYYYYGLTSVEEFEELLRDTADDYANQVCVVLAIAEKEGLDVDDDELQEQVDAEVADSGYDSQEEWEESGYIVSDVKFDLLKSKVRSYIMDTIEIQ